MVSTRRSKGSRGVGSKKNGRDLLSGVLDREKGIPLSRLGLHKIPSDRSGFYLCSNSRVGVVKLGKSDGGKSRGLRSRILSLSRHWGGDVTIHDLRVFEDTAELRRPTSPWLVPDNPRLWAKRFEAIVMKKMLAPRKEFYKLEDISALLSAIQDTIKDGEQNSPDASNVEKQINKGVHLYTRSKMRASSSRP